MCEKRVIEVNDFEHRIMMRALYEQRNDCLEENKPTEDLSDVLLKVIDAPTKKEKRKMARDERDER